MSYRTRIKICGITRPEDAQLSEQLGVDALGFVFCKASKRFIEPHHAKTISDQIAPFVTRVGLFLDASVAEIEHALNLLPGMIPQFHGRETASDCDRFGVPYLKAIGLGAGFPGSDELAAYKHATAFLFDSNEPGQLGGTGHVFDWEKLDHEVGKPVILAGGLNSENVQAAIAQVRPYAVDVSSGVELSKGVKDHEALRTFVDAVRISTAIIGDEDSPTIR